MIEKTILDYMTSKLSVPVAMEIPSPIPESFVVITKTDSSRENLLDGATVIADSYAQTKFQAALLNEQVKAALDELTDLPEISASYLATDYPNPNTTIERYRYQAVYTITHY